MVPRANHSRNEKSFGGATAVDDERIIEARDRAAADSGLLMCPEGAATLAAYLQEVESGRIGPDESAVLFNCATGLKYPMPPSEERLPPPINPRPSRPRQSLPEPK